MTLIPPQHSLRFKTTRTPGLFAPATTDDVINVANNAANATVGAMAIFMLRGRKNERRRAAGRHWTVTRPLNKLVAFKHVLESHIESRLISSNF